MKRIMVDMSATLIHHGHIRLLRKAKKKGKVIVALTLDKEILKYKGYLPELNYASRFEIINAIKYVDEVVPCPWLINEEFLNLHNIDYLVHGHDNSNQLPKSRLLIFQRTKNISSSILRGRVLKSIYETYLKRK